MVIFKEVLGQNEVLMEHFGGHPAFNWKMRVV